MSHLMASHQSPANWTLFGREIGHKYSSCTTNNAGRVHKAMLFTTLVVLAMVRGDKPGCHWTTHVKVKEFRPTQLQNGS